MDLPKKNEKHKKMTLRVVPSLTRAGLSKLTYLTIGGKKVMQTEYVMENRVYVNADGRRGGEKELRRERASLKTDELRCRRF